ncbi:MAG: cyclic nucleotide-binding domain-containing protein, partial [Chloroflexia bacterium]|nr:cyclic nucleotide-binding domain-containing protein [Chloroflexia bacterium]
QAGAMVAEADEACTDLYLIQDGSVEVWTSAVDEHTPPRQLATVLRGQLTGEMALIDGGRRSAALRAGSDGAVVLVLQREQLRALVEDDPALGNAVVWNLASSLALRLRLANFQMQMLATQLQSGVVGETV